MALDKHPVCSGDFAGGSDVSFNQSYGSIKVGGVYFTRFDRKMRGALFHLRVEEK